MKPIERRADVLFSRFIRERDGGCVWAQYHGGWIEGDDCWGELQCAHLIPKGRYGRIRWEPLNAAALCAKHHQHLDAHPAMRTAWATERLGGAAFAALLGQAMHGARPDVRAIVEDLERRVA